MQLAIGEFITDSSQGLPPSPRVWGRQALVLSGIYWIQLLVGASGLVTQWVVGSKRIGYTVARQFLLAQLWGFQLSPGRFPFFLLGICWLASIVDWIIMLPQETRPTPNLGCLSWRWLWQPHTYLLATSITLAVLSHYMIFNSLESLLYQNYFLYQKNFTNTPLFPTNNLKLYQPPFSLYLF